MTPMTAEALALSAELAELLAQPAVRREGDSWFITSITDKEEAEHRVDLLAGRLYCTCIGFRSHRKDCRHITKVRSLMENHGTHLIVQDHPPGSEMPDVWRSPQDLARRLADMKVERGLVQEFFKDVMIASRKGEADGDYGIIPGTEKPTLFKAGAEKLCELYGYAPVVSDIQETTDYDSGHYRVLVRVALIHKGSGVKIAEGVGECNSRESRYWYRWVFDRDVPAGLDKKTLKQRSGKAKGSGNPYTMYRVENEDLFSAWNTILKMAKKRALVDATLSATRSSGLFTQSAEHLDEWIDAEFTEVEDVSAPPPTKPSPPTPDPKAQAHNHYNDLMTPDSTHGAEQGAAAEALAGSVTTPSPAAPPDDMGAWWARTRRDKFDRGELMAAFQERFGKEPMGVSAEERDSFYLDLLVARDPQVPLV